MSEALHFLINAVFSVVASLFMLRLMLVLARVSYLHPATQAIDRLTRPLIVPLRRLLPNIGHIETASLVILLFAEALQLVALSLILPGSLSLGFLVVYALTGTLRLIIKAYFFALIAEIILSWVQPYSPATQLLKELVNPLMRPVRRLIPPVGNLDLSPIPVIIGLQFLLISIP
jgi:YggT family protein